ncbi:MAG: hypothetical protein M1374_01965 [Firmicutes bacterium]|jgi:RNA polymerase-binding transcription factor DksA|nr:hypothetical protein [Bacillota bacterium]
MTYFDEKEASAESVSEVAPAIVGKFESDNDKLSSLLNELEKKLIHMEEVLTRIDTAGYGKCQECDGDVEVEILKADPLAQRCSLHRSHN